MKANHSEDKAMKRALKCISMLSVLVSVLAVAQSQTFGSWFIDTTSRDGLYAATMNDSGALLGQFCFPGAGACVWLIGMRTRCETGEKYPILANSDVGARYLEIYCDGELENGLHRYAFTDFDAVDGLVKSGSRVGFAIPLRQDQFIVVRFLLNGSKAAISAMRTTAERHTLPNKGETRDEYM